MSLFKLGFLIHFLIIAHVGMCQTLTKQQQISLAYELMNNHHLDAIKMLEKIEDFPTQFNIANITYRTSPTGEPSRWLEGKSTLDLMGSMNTMIHESHHEFTSSYYLKMLEEHLPEGFDHNSSYRSFFLSNEEIILVRLDDHFNSHELKNDIPKSLRTFRFNPYIIPKDRYLGSQVSGIYGLMNEFNAYYQGTLMTMQLIPEYFDRARSDVKILQSFVQHVGHSYAAYFEFKYYCLMYLKRAQERYPKIFNSTLSNMALRTVYTKVHDRYQTLIQTFDKLLLTMVDDLTSRGIKSQVKDGYFWIGGYGVGVMNEDAEKLNRALNDPKLISLHEQFVINE